MLVSLAWRNLGRNLRRTLLTGGAVAFAVMLSTCMRGLQDGGYAQMIDQAVRLRLAHLQVHPEGYLRSPEPALAIDDAEALARRIEAIDGVDAAAPRAIAEGVAARDTQSWPVEVWGVDAAAEASVSVVGSRVLGGDRGEGWCREEQSKALRLFGADEQLFDRWCAAAREGRYLESDDERAVVVGAGVAKRLTVNVGDDMTLQVVRARGSDDEAGAERGSVSQRRFTVVGLVRTGNPEIDDRLVYVPIATATSMLGTTGPNELAVMLDDIGALDRVRGEVAAIAAGRGLEAHTWYQRNPTLKSLIDTDSQMGVLMLVILAFLVALGVINTTFMSVLERTRELGVMLAVGMRRSRLFAMILSEVALLGVAAVSVGLALGGAFEAYGRWHGWPLEWITDAELSEVSLSGSVVDPVYHSALSGSNLAIIVVGIYLLFLAAGLFPAFKASRLEPVEAMRAK